MSEGAFDRWSNDLGYVEMTSLRALHASMRTLKTDIQQFPVRMGIAQFDCLFVARGKPFALTMTSRGENPTFIKFDVVEGYRIEKHLGDRYGPLVRLLYRDGRSGQKLMPFEFLSQLNVRIPKDASPSRVPSPRRIAELRHDLEEGDKRFFHQWGFRSPGPSVSNKAKTLAILGREALEHSILINKSSIWTTTPTDYDWRPKRS